MKRSERRKKRITYALGAALSSLFFILLLIAPHLSLIFLYDEGTSSYSLTWGYFLYVFQNILFSGSAFLASQGRVRVAFLKAIIVGIITLGFATANTLYSISIYVQGTGFNDLFFEYCHPFILVTSPIYLWGFIGTLIYLFICFLVALYFSLRPVLRGRVRRYPISFLVLMLLTLYLTKPAGSFIRYMWRMYVSCPHCRMCTARSDDHILKENPEVYQHVLRKPALVPPKNFVNVVWIYIESLEQSYFTDKRYSPLLPRLTAFKQQAVDFTNFEQVADTNSTIRGTFASQCGMPIQAFNHIPIQDRWKKGQHLCFMNVLASFGYETIRIQGDSEAFANTVHIAPKIGIQKLLGFHRLHAQVEKPFNKARWGIYDEALFKIAKDYFNELLWENKPFALAIATIDNHEPGTSISPMCQSIEGLKNMTPFEQAAACTDSTVSSFIDFIRESPVASHTIIVVSSDHLYPGPNHFKQSNQSRRLTFFILFPDGRKSIITKRGTHFDMPSTILEAMNFKGYTDMGLGRSVLNSKEKDGYLLNKFYSEDKIQKLVCAPGLAKAWL